MFHATASASIRALLDHYGDEGRRVLDLTGPVDMFVASLTLAEYCADHDRSLLTTVQALHALDRQRASR